MVADAAADARLQRSPLVANPALGLRFLAGCPLAAPGGAGACRGMLYVAGRQPRRFGADQLAVLAGFAEL